MSIQTKIAKASEKLQRKLFDQQIFLMGGDTDVIRIKFSEDKYHDRSVTAINSSVVSVIINIPAEIPLYRLRPSWDETTSPTQNDVYVDEATGMYLYDLLPIEVYAKFSDNIERRDILVKRYRDDQTTVSGKELKLIIQITEPLGGFSNSGLVWRKFNAAPVTSTLPSDVQSLINSY